MYESVHSLGQYKIVRGHGTISEKVSMLIICITSQHHGGTNLMGSNGSKLWQLKITITK